MARPFLIFGDGPSLPTGLARIARDLSQRAATLPELAVTQVGLVPEVGAPPPPWPFWGFSRTDDDWGAEALRLATDWTCARQPTRAIPIVLTVWDASRLLPWTEQPTRVRRWGYFAIDGENARQTIGGPVGEVIARYDRVLGYGRYGSRILRGRRTGPVAYLPHGLDLDVWTAPSPDEAAADVDAYLGLEAAGRPILGCVATNQPRKDLAYFCAVLAELKQRGMPVFGWLHTDQIVKAWSIPQLATDFGLTQEDWAITGTAGALSDRALASLYSACAATLAPGLGEGFGYPLVESLACGTPAVHHTYAGGAELVPMAAWKVPVRPGCWRFDSVYNLLRPVLDPVDGANAVERAMRWKAEHGDRGRLYCRGAVAHLDWAQLWPRWASWIRQGL